MHNLMRHLCTYISEPGEVKKKEKKTAYFVMKAQQSVTQRGYFHSADH